MKAVAAIVLAAGGSTRLGTPKQLVRFRGHALVHHAAAVALDAGCAPVVVVLGAEADVCANEIWDLPVHVAINENWRTGIAGSIHTGLIALAEARAVHDAALLCLCDQPCVSAETLRVLLTTFESGKSRIVASEYAGAIGVPAIFHRSLFGELRALQGAEGARRLFARFPREVTAVPHEAAEFDLDTPADYERLITMKSQDRIHTPMR